MLDRVKKLLPLRIESEKATAVQAEAAYKGKNYTRFLGVRNLVRK